MERVGRVDTPVRRVVAIRHAHFGRSFHPHESTIQTVVRTGRLVIRRLFVGDDQECFERAAELSLECNFSGWNLGLL